MKSEKICYTFASEKLAWRIVKREYLESSPQSPPGSVPPWLSPPPGSVPLLAQGCFILKFFDGPTPELKRVLPLVSTVNI